jgi:hypothetical protein
MSGGESFVARWSRRKRDVAAQSDTAKNPPPSAAETAKPTTGEPPMAIPLPPIESIESASDIKAFLAPGVPLELARAALRRAWAVDPAIGDFIGLSENAWDFNAPGGVSGFGSLDLEQVRRLVAQVVDEPPGADPTSATASTANCPATWAEADVTNPTIHARGAAQNRTKRSSRVSRPRHHHGGALPH